MRHPITSVPLCPEAGVINKAKLRNNENICTFDDKNCAPGVRYLCKKNYGYRKPVALDGAVYTRAV